MKKKWKPWSTDWLAELEFYQDGNHIYGKCITGKKVPPHSSIDVGIWLFDREDKGIFNLSRLVINGESFKEEAYHNKSYFRITLHNDSDVEKQLPLQMSFYIDKE